MGFRLMKANPRRTAYSGKPEREMFFSSILVFVFVVRPLARRGGAFSERGGCSRCRAGCVRRIAGIVSTQVEIVNV